MSKRVTWTVTMLVGVIAIGVAAMPSAQAEESPTVDVDVEGIGATKEEALSDAFRKAVQKAVGTLVDSVTIVKNDQLIKDEVLEFSNGFVRSYKILSGETNGGLVRLRIWAEVDRGKVLHKLRNFIPTITQFDGIGIKIVNMHAREAKKKATILLREMLLDLPNVLVAKGPSRSDIQFDDGECRIPVSVSVDPQRFAQVHKSLETLLQLAESTKEFTNSRIEETDGPVDIRVHEVDFEASRFRDTFREISAADGMAVWAAVPSGTSALVGGNCRWDGYGLKVDAKQVLEAIHGRLMIRLRMLDEHMKVVVKDEFEATPPSDVTDFPSTESWLFADARLRSRDGQDSVKGLYIAPAMIVTDRSKFFLVKEMTYVRKIVLSEAELGRCRFVECTPFLAPRNITEAEEDSPDRPVLPPNAIPEPPKPKINSRVIVTKNTAAMNDDSSNLPHPVVGMVKRNTVGIIEEIRPERYGLRLESSPDEVVWVPRDFVEPAKTSRNK